MLLLAHIDVVEAKKEDWSDGLDPFKLTERDGYLLRPRHARRQGDGRDLRRQPDPLQARGLRPKRDLIVALTATRRAARTTASRGC
jgi:hypothetical protein